MTGKIIIEICEHPTNKEVPGVKMKMDRMNPMEALKLLTFCAHDIASKIQINKKEEKPTIFKPTSKATDMINQKRI